MTTLNNRDEADKWFELVKSMMTAQVALGSLGLSHTKACMEHADIVLKAYQNRTYTEETDKEGYKCAICGLSCLIVPLTSRDGHMICNKCKDEAIR